jgi:mitochondrial fission protein ELM1
MLGSLKIMAISGALVALTGAFWYVSGLRADLMQEKINAQILERSISDQQRVIDRMMRDFEDIRETNRALAAEAQRQREEVQNLANRLNVTATGQSRDFGLLAAQRPAAIQRLVNRGTTNAMRCLELASGAERTEAELAATLSSQINPECPTLANPNYQGPAR